MNDRELLEMAAKAYWPESSEVSFRFDEREDAIVYIDAANQDHNGCDVEMVWNPLADDGDALRLAVKLGINPIVNWDHKPGAFSLCQEQRLAATRRAIVRAAAEIGRAMP